MPHRDHHTRRNPVAADRRLRGPRCLVRRGTANRRGATVVEMALTMPILFLLLFACYEFGRANMIRHTAQGAAYEAARIGIVPGATSDEIHEAADFILGTVGVRTYDLSVVPETITDQTKSVEVTIRVPMRDNSSIGLLFNENAIYQGTCEMKRETLDP